MKEQVSVDEEGWVYIPQKDKAVGRLIEGGRVFRQEKSREDHRVLKGSYEYGLQLCLLDYLKEEGVEVWRLDETTADDRLVRYEVSIEDWDENGVPDELNPEDGVQVFIKTPVLGGGEVIRDPNTDKPHSLDALRRFT